MDPKENQAEGGAQPHPEVAAVAPDQIGGGGSAGGDPQVTDSRATDPAAPVPGTGAQAPEVRMLPVHWWRARGASEAAWPAACLAAAASGWDPQQVPGGEVTAAEYDAGLALGARILEAARQRAQAPGKMADSTAHRRIFVLAHPHAMHAVVAYKPRPEEILVLITSQREDVPDAAQLQGAVDHCWGHVLWPAQGSAEMAWILDNRPGWYANTYPAVYSASYGMREENVRGK